MGSSHKVSKMVGECLPFFNYLEPTSVINIASPRLLASRSVLVCKRIVNWQGEAKPSLSSSQASCKPKQTWTPKVEGCYIFYCARLMLLNPYLGYIKVIRGGGCSFLIKIAKNWWLLILLLVIKIYHIRCIPGTVEGCKG